MKKEVLESKIAELLDIEDSDKSIVFSLFKDKIAKHLNIGEAIKINGLGIFQLKEQVSGLGKDKSIDSNKNISTLVFSPESKQSEDESLFINFEIDGTVKDEAEFDPNVFQLGIGKTLATSVQMDDKGVEENEKSTVEIYEEKISKFIDESEKLKNFDLWEDYLKAKETTNMLEEEPEIENTSLTEETTETSNVKEETLLEKDFVELDEDEVFDDLIEDNEFIQDDSLETFNEEIEIDNNLIDEIVEDDSEKVVNELINDDNELIDSEESVSEEVSEEIDEVYQENTDPDGPELEIDEPVDLEIDIPEVDNIEEIQEDDLLEKTEVLPKEESEPITEENEELEESTNVESEPVISKQKKSRLPFYFLISAFIIVGAIGIYYLFFQKPAAKYEEQSTSEIQTELTPSKDITDELPNKNTEDVTLEDNKIVDDFENIKTSDAKVNPAEIKTNESETKKENVDEETEVAKNIYYDGFVYSVQVSSWKQRSVAQREMNKLNSKGLPAYLVKIYIPKFKGTWHRVRLGPYTTLIEARDAQNKINK